MKKKLRTLILFFFAFNTIQAQTLVPFLKKDGKYIYVDSATMKPVIWEAQESVQNEFDGARMFHNGLAVVKKYGKWGLISSEGLLLNCCKYDWISDFDGNFSIVGLASKSGVILANQCGLINGTGKLSLWSKYSGIRPFFEGIAMVYKEFEDESNYAITDSNGITESTKIKIRKYGYIDKNGKEIIPLIYDQADDFLENVARVGIKSKYGDYGFINKDGNVVLPLKYDVLSKLSDGISISSHSNYKDSAFVELINLRTNTKKLLNYRWKEFGINNYNHPISFSDGLIPFKVREKGIGILDSTGNEILKPSIKYQEILNFFEGYAMVKSNENKIGFINKMGEEVIPMKYEEIDFFSDDFGHHKFSEGLACVKLNNKIGFIDYSGNEIIQLKYDKISQDFKNGFACVGIGDSYFYIDRIGNEYREK